MSMEFVINDLVIVKCNDGVIRTGRIEKVGDLISVVRLDEGPSIAADNKRIGKSRVTKEEIAAKMKAALESSLQSPICIPRGPAAVAIGVVKMLLDYERLITSAVLMADDDMGGKTNGRELIADLFDAARMALERTGAEEVSTEVVRDVTVADKERMRLRVHYEQTVTFGVDMAKGEDKTVAHMAYLRRDTPFVPEPTGDVHTFTREGTPVNHYIQIETGDKPILQKLTDYAEKEIEKLILGTPVRGEGIDNAAKGSDGVHLEVGRNVVVTINGRANEATIVEVREKHCRIELPSGTRRWVRHARIRQGQSNWPRVCAPHGADWVNLAVGQEVFVDDLGKLEHGVIETVGDAICNVRYDTGAIFVVKNEKITQAKSQRTSPREALIKAAKMIKMMTNGLLPTHQRDFLVDRLVEGQSAAMKHIYSYSRQDDEMFGLSRLNIGDPHMGATVLGNTPPADGADGELLLSKAVFPNYGIAMNHDDTVASTDTPAGDTQPAPAEPFAIGEEVRLKATGQQMFVEGMESGKVRCRWTKPTGLVQSAPFNVDDVEKA